MNQEKNDLAAGQNPGYEKRDFNPKVILGLGIAIVVLITFFVIMLDQYFLIAKEKQVYEAVLKPESKELQKLRAYENEILTSYAEIDPDQGIYQIPIERAMELMAAEASK